MSEARWLLKQKHTMTRVPSLPQLHTTEPARPGTQRERERARDTGSAEKEKKGQTNEF